MRRKEPIEKVCGLCGNVFKTKNKNRKYCSRKCVGTSNQIKFRTGKFHICKTCDTKFYRSNSYTKAHYCCQKCAEIGHKKPRIELVCCRDGCDNKIYKTQINLDHYIIKGKKWFCSDKCSRKFPNRKGIIISVRKAKKCEYCGNEFMVVASNKSHSKKRFCSNSCRGKVIHNKKKTGVNKKCANCDNEFYAQKYNINKQCCSPECASIFKRGKSLNISDHTRYLKRINAIKQRYLSPTFYNATACHYFRQLNKEFGWNGLFAENRGEFKIHGYFLDYYVPELNLVIEYDEKAHFDKNGKLKSRDVRRQHEIENILHCKFIRVQDSKINSYEDFKIQVIKNII